MSDGSDELQGLRPLKLVRQGAKGDPGLATAAALAVATQFLQHQHQERFAQCMAQITATGTKSVRADG